MSEFDATYTDDQIKFLNNLNRGEKIFNINMIWVDVIYRDQKGMEINRDGRGFE